MELCWKNYAGKRICVALSGGADSVCLLHLLRSRAERFSITLSAIHIEHGIRGEESLRDMNFCDALCKEWGIPLKVERVDVPELVKERGGSVEQVARAVRYEAFRNILEQGESDLVATAHHANDVAETVLFRLARGTGLSGMKAIMEYGGIIRPLLSFTRDEILAYVHEKSLPFVEDSTNENEDYTRNYIRKTVLPAFEKIHGNATKHLVQFAALAAAADDYLQQTAESAIVRVADEEWVPVHFPDILFYRACLFCMQQYENDGDYTRANLDEIAKLRTAQSGKKIAVPAMRKGQLIRYAIREGNYIVFYWDSKDKQPQPEVSFTPKTSLYTSPAPFSVREVDISYVFDTGRGNPRELFVDLDAFPQGCVVRTRREGDCIVPFGGNKKTLKKFLTDKKISARLGKKLPLIANGSEILAVVGVGISDKVKVTKTTRRRGIIR